MTHALEDLKQLVLVTGAGRSGTSTMAGTLHMLGYHLPRPVLQANESNPKGFFESRWSVRFHSRLLDRAVVQLTDGRPTALALVLEQVDEDVRAELRRWLAIQLEKATRVMVKDPRNSWVPQVWAEEASALGAQTSFVAMLRPPWEVVRSRESNYHQNRAHMDDVAFAVMNLTGWINTNLTVEQQTRDAPRVFVRYDDLRADWRSAMRIVRDDLGLRFDHPLNDEPHAEVDAFVEPSLNRHQGSWEGLGLPNELLGLADELYDALERLADAHGHDSPIEAQLDELGVRYAELYTRSERIANDSVVARGRLQRAVGIDEGRREVERQGSETALEQMAAGRVRRAVGRLRSRFPKR